MNKSIIIIVLVLVVLGGYIMLRGDNDNTLTNQMPNSGENPEPGSGVHDLPVEPAAAAAREDLATKLGISTGSIVILEVKEMTWTDGCLGLGGPAESCLQALVPGFRVEMMAQNETYVYRTDATGSAVRAE